MHILFTTSTLILLSSDIQKTLVEILKGNVPTSLRTNVREDF